MPLLPRDDQIGDKLYVVLEDGVVLGFELLDDEVCVNGLMEGAHLFSLGDAEKIHRALGAVLRGLPASYWKD